VFRLVRTTTAANDDFANRGDLTGWPLPITIETNLSHATIEPGETPWYSGANDTLWWTYTAPSNLNLMLSTTSSSTPESAPILKVFTGDSVATLREIVGMNWGVLCVASPSNLNRVTIRALAGTAYQIGIDARDLPGQATLCLEQVPAPPNDDFAQAIPLAGITATAAASNLGATYESPDEPRHEYGIAGSIWWSWTAPGDGNVQLSTAGSEPDSAFYLSVWSGDTVTTLLEVAANSTIYDPDYSRIRCGGVSSLANFKARAGQTYFIAADGIEGATGTVKLSLRLLSPPANDDFAQGLPLAGLTNLVRASNEGATREDSEPWHANEPGGQSLWWDWTAPTSGQALLDTTGSAVPVALAVYTGEVLNGLEPIASNLLGYYYHTNRVSFQAVAGTTYHIAADSIGQAGEVVFSLVEEPLLRVASAGFDTQGRFQVNIGGVTQNPFVLEASTNLVRWVPLLTNVLVDQSFLFIDPDSKLLNRRFYHAVELP
jgi:hypothetical protein